MNEPSLATACKQEMYDFSVKDILNKLSDTEEYLNPNYFIRFLEIKYECNIFLFKINSDYPEGILTIPRHNKGYYRNKPNFNNSIFIYENMGIESDNAKYPQCELICRWYKKGKPDELQYKFESEYDNFSISFVKI
jgi:hypothetical protein